MVLGWITGSPLRFLRRPREDLADPPPLALRQGPGLLDQHPVADLAPIGLVVGLELLGPSHDPLVAGVAVHALDEDHAGLGHLVAHHHALSRLLVRHLCSCYSFPWAPGLRHAVPRRDLTLACSFAPRPPLPPGVGYALRPMLSSRSRRTVFALARSRRARPTRAGLFATPMARWSLRLNSSSVRSLTFCSSSSLCISRHLIAFMLASEGPRPAHEPGLDADLLGGQPEPVTGGGLVHALHLVEDAAGLDHGHPELGIPLALAHPGLGGLLGHRLVGKDPDEDLAASLDTARERHPRRFDLPVGHPPGFERLEAVVAEGQGRPALLELQGHVLGHQLRVQLRVHHLLDVEVDLLGGAALDLVLELLHLGALAADDDARPGRVDRDPGAVGRTLDVDPRDPRVVERGLDEPADLDVLVEQVGIPLGGEPPGAPRARGAQPEPDRMCLLSHGYLCADRSPGVVSSLSTMVRWLVRCLMKKARPMARGETRLAEGPPSAVAWTTRRSSRSRTW